MPLPILYTKCIIFSEKRNILLLKGGPSLSVGGGISPSIGGGPSPSIGGGISPSIGGGPSLSIDEGISPSIGGGPSLSIDDGISPSIGGGPSLSIDDGISPSIGGGPSLSIDDGISPSIDDGISPSIGGGPFPLIGGGLSSSIGGGTSASIGGGSTSNVGGNDISILQLSITENDIIAYYYLACGFDKYICLWQSADGWVNVDVIGGSIDVPVPKGKVLTYESSQSVLEMPVLTSPIINNTEGSYCFLMQYRAHEDTSLSIYLTIGNNYKELWNDPIKDLKWQLLRVDLENISGNFQ
ncbi:uncharacterized protein LOC134263666, partial [Saccostrea cucullata]|uniref:uncharacterized protein LOC134263666 n=1 Tax=Saccostrea cuccullata TaxID=36930 RepID=UPI002ED19343